LQHVFDTNSDFGKYLTDVYNVNTDTWQSSQVIAYHLARFLDIDINARAVEVAEVAEVHYNAIIGDTGIVIKCDTLDMLTQLTSNNPGLVTSIKKIEQTVTDFSL
jgi:NADH dehydrogenase FAD-containing subunit